MNLLPWVQLFFLDTVNLIWLALGLFVAGAGEAFLWKTPWFQAFNHPIQETWFGTNKKWRGLISLPLTHSLSVFLFQLLEKPFLHQLPGDLILFSNFNFLAYGLLVGFVFNLSELPNSFIKRRLQIPAGDESSPIFYFIDHADSTYGTLILWYFYFHISSHLILTGLVVTPLLFMGATALRKQLGLK